eukprot:357523-Chlamydomonas_euryale.AAC.4
MCTLAPHAPHVHTGAARHAFQTAELPSSVNSSAYTKAVHNVVASLQGSDGHGVAHRWGKRWPQPCRPHRTHLRDYLTSGHFDCLQERS